MAMKLISSEEICRTPIFRVTIHRAMDPDGLEINRAIVQHQGSAVTMAVDSRGRILLLRQYRLPAHANLWERPAGRVDPGETVLHAAIRETARGDRLSHETVDKVGEFLGKPRSRG
jgi:hypothetical protein